MMCKMSRNSRQGDRVSSALYYSLLFVPSEEQKTSDCSDNTKDETVQQRGEGGKCHSSGLSRNACDNAKNVTVEVSVKPWPNRVATSRRKLGLLATPFGQA